MRLGSLRVEYLRVWEWMILGGLSFPIFSKTAFVFVMSTVLQTLQGAKTYNKGRGLYSEGEPAREAHEGNTDKATFLSMIQESVSRLPQSLHGHY